jgi:hypothetical protein
VAAGRVDNDNFGTTVGFVDDNGGCDLESVDPLVGSQIDVQAYFADEKLLRDTCISLTASTGRVAAPPVAPLPPPRARLRRLEARASRPLASSLTGRSNTLG